MTNAVALKKRMKGAELLTPKQRVFAEYFVSHYPKGTKKALLYMQVTLKKLVRKLEVY